MELSLLYHFLCIWPWCSCTVRKSHFANDKEKTSGILKNSPNYLFGQTSVLFNNLY